MKRFKTPLLFLFLVFFCISFTQAQDPVPKDKAKNVLLRTNRVIGFAHMSVKKGKIYTGNLGNAVKHERYAKKLYNEGNYLKAIHHSGRARKLAHEAIKANKVKPTAEVSLTPEEESLMGAAPSDQELDDELNKEDAEALSDEKLISSNNLGLEIQ